MNQETSKQIKLGAFVLAGIILFIVVLVLIGREQNLFERTFDVYCEFENVEGLQKGSNVWFSGVKVGTVQSVEIQGPGVVRLDMSLTNASQPFLKKDATASVGSDGFIGNKIVILEGGSPEASSLAEGDKVTSKAAQSTDDLIATFSVTNENLSKITEDIKGITAAIRSGDGSLGSLIQDSALYQSLNSSVYSAKLATRNTAKATEELSRLVADINQGEGMVGAVLRDTSYEGRLDRTLLGVEKTADDAAAAVAQLSQMSESLKAIVAGLDDPNSPVGVMLSDSTFARNLQESMNNLRVSSDELDRTLEAAQESFLMRKRIFRKNKEEEEQPSAEGMPRAQDGN
ncbi:MAG: MlaD family protein [Bacteroidota bacterium]